MNETPRKPERTGDDPDGPLNVKRYVWWMLLIAVAVLVLTQLLASPMITGEVPISYSELKEKIRAGAVEKVTLVDEFVVATPTEEALQASRDEGPDIELKSWRTTRVRDDESLVPLLEDYDIAYEAQYTSSCDASFVWFWLVGMFAVFMLWSMMMRRAGGIQRSDGCRRDRTAPSPGPPGMSRPPNTVRPGGCREPGGTCMGWGSAFSAPGRRRSALQRRRGRTAARSPPGTHRRRGCSVWTSRPQR